MITSYNFKILIVDDDPDILDILSFNLTQAGYIVNTAINGKLAIAQAQKDIPHLILLDVMMPVMNGVEACYIMRQNSMLDNTIITFLSARSEDYSQIEGFNAGADDYIAKPIKPKLLLLKIESLLKRLPLNTVNSTLSIITFKNILINKQNHTVTINHQNINLTRKELELLALFLSNPGKVFKREEIFKAIWSHDVIVGDRTIDVHIRKLREKIGDDILVTIKGIGYKIEA